MKIKMRTNAKMRPMLEESGVKTLERPRKIMGKKTEKWKEILYN